MRGREEHLEAKGFTLVEVMFALAMLAVALILLLQATGANVAASQRSQLMGVATDLARAKMYDLEEELVVDGFQQLDQTKDGKFDKEGWPTIYWKAEITKIEIPNLAAMKSLGAEDEKGGATGGSGATGGGIMGGMLGGLGGGDGGAGAGMITSQFELFRGILEEAIRKVHLTVSYRVAGSNEEVTVDCYFTDPEAVNRVINFGPGAAQDGSKNKPGPGEAKK